MATSKRVSCKKKYLGTEHYNHILGIGGVLDGTRWYESESSAITNIEYGLASYHVKVNDKDVKVVVETITKDGIKHKYLKTEADGYKPNNLVSLPECP